jgi:carbamoyl-phosphate synthase large subunit
VATQRTAEFIANRGIPVASILKVSEGRPNVVDAIKNGLKPARMTVA